MGSLTKYLHISNGGLTFKVSSTELGAELQVSLSTLGHEATTNVYVASEDLLVLSDFFKEASEIKFSKNYCHAAKIK